MRPLTKLTLPAIACALLSSVTQAALVIYVPTGSSASSTNGTAPPATSLDPHVTASTLSNVIPGAPATTPPLSSGASGPLRTSNGTWTFGTDAWLFVNSQYDGSSSTSTGAANDYFSFTVGTTTSGDTLELTTLTFDYGAGTNISGGSSGTFHYAVFASVDGGAFGQLGSTFNTGTIALTQNTTHTFANQIIDLTSLIDAEEVEFRIWVGSSLSSGGAGSIFRNITVNGAVVPEPATALLGSLGVLGLLRRRRP